MADLEWEWLSRMRQDEHYPHVRYWKPQRDNRGLSSWAQMDQEGWTAECCSGGCHGCSGAMVVGVHPRPIDAHLARLDWLGEIPVGPVRVMQKSLGDICRELSPPTNPARGFA